VLNSKERIARCREGNGSTIAEFARVFTDDLARTRRQITDVVTFGQHATKQAV